MHWNGYAGCVMGVGGALGCDGDVRLHGAHRSLILCMAGVIPGQKIEHSARDSMDVHPPCAACNAMRHSSLSDGGMTTRPPYMTTSSTVYRYRLLRRETATSFPMHSLFAPGNDSNKFSNALTVCSGERQQQVLQCTHCLLRGTTATSSPMHSLFAPERDSNKFSKGRKL